MLNIGSYVNHVMKIIVTMIFANFANKFTPIIPIIKRMIYGLAVINVIVG